MARPREHLSRAPAREALVDLTFERPLTLAQVDRFVDKAKPHFREATDMYQASVAFDLAGSSTHTQQSVWGRRLENRESHYVLQCRLDGLSVSRLSPYGSWAELKGETQRWWNLFGDAVGAMTVSRVAVRYINAIALPLPIGDFKEYFTCPPEVPPELPQSVSGFIQRVIVPLPDDCTAVVTQALENASAELNIMNVLLDIEVSSPVRNGELWTVLDRLRDEKNRVFFAHLKEKAVELFE